MAIKTFLPLSRYIKRQTPPCLQREPGWARHQEGFTVVELMIATVVFTMVLITITIGVLHFTSGYYRGINSSSTQVTAQNALDTIAQTIQFSAGGNGAYDSSGLNPGDDGVFCAGSKMFFFTAGKEYLGGDAVPGNLGLYETDWDGGSCDSSAVTSPMPSGTQLLGSHMRVTDVSIDDNGNGLWSVQLGVAFGDSDLMCSPNLNGQPGGCDPDTPLTPTDSLSGSDVKCRLTTGSQFCSVARLTNTVKQRAIEPEVQ